MRPSKNRRAIRDLARRAAERARAPEAPPPPAVYEMACICGQLLRVTSSHDERRCACPSCKRKFLVTLAPDKRTGAILLCPVYLDDSVTTGETFTAEPPSPPDSVSGKKGQLDDTIEPPPPPSISFSCPCGRKLLARASTYDRRVRCPDCGVRMLLSVVYDRASGRHVVQPVRLEDAPSGDTGTGEKA
jgi:DNA-directed RNA polymerase subunit RPC12/RpoP